jgi:hypothetical protein
LHEVLESIVLPALLFAEQDRQRGVLEPPRARDLAALVTTIVDDLAEPLEAGPPAPDQAVAAGGRVLCVGARYGLDTAAAGLLAQLLRGKGLLAEVANAGSLVQGGPTPGPFDVLCLSYLDATAPRHARRLLLRLRARLGRGIPSCVCLWGSSPDELKPGLATTHAEAAAAGLGEAVTKKLELLARREMPLETPSTEIAAAE